MMGTLIPKGIKSSPMVLYITYRLETPKHISPPNLFAIFQNFTYNCLLHISRGLPNKIS